MKKIILVLAAVAVLSACDDREITTRTEEIKTMCIEGVTYIAFKEFRGNSGYGFMSVKLDRDSKVVACD